MVPGDIIVINGIPFTVSAYTSATALTVAPAPAANISPGVTDWFIVRSDTIRAPQAYNSVMAVWQPPLGIMNYDGYSALVNIVSF